MSLSTKDTSTQGFSGVLGNNREIFSSVSQTQSSSVAPQSNQMDLGVQILSQNMHDIRELQKKVEELEENKNKTQDFYGSLTKFNTTLRKMLVFVMWVPVLQLIACAIIVYFLGKQDQLPSILNWILGGVSVFSLFEVIFVPVRLYILESKIDDLEKRIS